MRQVMERRVTFFRNGEPFHSVDQLSTSDQEQFIKNWHKVEEKLWRGAYESLMESLDPKQTMTLEVYRKECKG
ncbi:hypothetical protein [Fictibacillus barbaricus]|uniref:ASCH domain-containing protein n=1 Tax=Fictibacillus barbaricus TaxID=182136 RepID=A0ABU1U5F1_9BACL|nr:hypothetical protein [Fictibacillus barbaricus]MDR7074681.1 hypothetical protein [Fictibacillus barbaricus]